MMNVQRDEKLIAAKTLTTGAVVQFGAAYLHCGRCGNKSPLYRPGIFRVFLPEKIEKIVPESWRSDPLRAPELRELEEKGITPVFVPDDDPDHRGTVYDDEEASE